MTNLAEQNLQIKYVKGSETRTSQSVMKINWFFGPQGEIFCNIAYLCLRCGFFFKQNVSLKVRNNLLS